MAKKAVPIVTEKPPKPVSEMTDEERLEFARSIFEKMKAARKPAG